MKVTRVDGNGEATYEVRELTEDQAVLLGALADFPLWGRQPKEVAAFCAALHTGVEEATEFAIHADAEGMTAHTTVELN